ncbi:unnamed protein product [Musa acuminata var. zebrina]
MWWEGGRFSWGAKEGRAGIVVVFVWPSSLERQLEPYIQLYSSFGWRSLICHADFLTLYFPEKATSLADGVLKELVQELNVSPLPIVFSAFSGAPRGCMYKVLQLIDGKCEGRLSVDNYQLVKDCLCGQIYDSSPVDFTGDLGTRFILHPTVLKRSHPPRVVSWMAKALASGLSTFFIDRFEGQHADYLQTLYSSANVGPFLIFCSEDDELAPYPVVCNFAHHLEELGGDVKLIKWNSSPHAGHHKHHAADYKTAVSELLSKAATIYSERRQQFHVQQEGQRGVTNDPCDHFLLPSSMEYHDTRDGCSTQDEQKCEIFHLPYAPSINAHSVLAQILFDGYVPKNVEGWDIKPNSSLTGRQTLPSGHRHARFSPMKHTRRSRL